MTHVQASLPARRLRAGVALVAAGLVVFLGLVATGAVAGASTNLAPVNGQGSTYAALAFQTWTQKAEDQGLTVNYTATGSPAGLSAYAQNTATFAGTEGEYTELYPHTANANTNVPRGFAYTPDVAGGVALMYHVALTSAGKVAVTYLHLSPLTIARIFLGVIRTWTSPTISKDNKGLVLPHESITLDLRSGQSGTTALFYDFVKHEDPSQYAQWANTYGFTTTNRVWEVDNGTGPQGSFGSGSGFVDFPGSDQQAKYISSTQGLWSIGYDEFGYALVYHDDVAWMENASGNWVQPYARNIAAALKTAVLAPTTSQTLNGVYTSTTPTAYPASYYSYILYQCAPTATRSTCKMPYASQGVTNTLAKFMRYVACTGQVTMANIGYSPLPAPLAQFMANAIGYMTGQPPDTLNASNCADPQFEGNLGVGAAPPPDPTVGKTSLGPGPGGGSSSATSGGASSTGSSSATGSTAANGSTGATSGASTGSSSGSTGASGKTAAGSAGAHTATTVAGAAAAVGSTGSGTQAVGGGSSSYRTNDPVAYDVPAAVGATAPWTWLLMMLLLLIPVGWLTVALRRKSQMTADKVGSDQAAIKADVSNHDDEI